MAETVHASLVNVAGLGVLLRGPSGSGKSELALRLVDTPGFGISTTTMPAQLVADDRVELFSRDQVLCGRPAQSLQGLLEIRGLGIIRMAFMAESSIDLIVDLTAEGERMPDFAHTRVELAGHFLPVLRLPPGQIAAPARIRAALALIANPGQLHA